MRGFLGSAPEMGRHSSVGGAGGYYSGYGRSVAQRKLGTGGSSSEALVEAVGLGGRRWLRGGGGSSYGVVLLHVIYQPGQHSRRTSDSNTPATPSAYGAYTIAGSRWRQRAGRRSSLSDTGNSFNKRIPPTAVLKPIPYQSEPTRVVKAWGAGAGGNGANGAVEGMSPQPIMCPQGESQHQRWGRRCSQRVVRRQLSRGFARQYALTAGGGSGAVSSIVVGSQSPTSSQVIAPAAQRRPMRRRQLSGNNVGNGGASGSVGGNGAVVVIVHFQAPAITSSLNQSLIQNQAISYTIARPTARLRLPPPVCRTGLTLIQTTV